MTGRGNGVVGHGSGGAREWCNERGDEWGNGAGDGAGQRSNKAGPRSAATSRATDWDGGATERGDALGPGRLRGDGVLQQSWATDRGNGAGRRSLA